MSFLLRGALAAALVLALPLSVQAQANAPRKITPGVYQVVPDPSFAAGFDVSAVNMRFHGDTIMVIEQGGAVMARARTSYEGEHLVWTDLEGELMCDGVAKYKLAFSDEGKTIRLTPVADACAERSAIIAQISLKRRDG